MTTGSRVDSVTRAKTSRRRRVAGFHHVGAELLGEPHRVSERFRICLVDAGGARVRHREHGEPEPRGVGGQFREFFDLVRLVIGADVDVE